jgi:hypothetical protein
MSLDVFPLTNLQLLFGEKHTVKFIPVFYLVNIFSPLYAFHIFKVLSAPQLTILRPSGE